MTNESTVRALSSLTAARNGSTASWISPRSPSLTRAPQGRRDSDRIPQPRGSQSLGGEPAHPKSIQHGESAGPDALRRLDAIEVDAGTQSTAALPHAGQNQLVCARRDVPIVEQPPHP